jgi:signal transduction histidine kinase
MKADIPDCRVASEPIYLNADRTRLAQVFGNLLNNTSKYTKARGSISLTAERHDHTVVVTVKDNGAGIPPDKLKSIFDMFTRSIALQIDRRADWESI